MLKRHKDAISPQKYQEVGKQNGVVWIWKPKF